MKRFLPYAGCDTHILPQLSSVGKSFPSGQKKLDSGGIIWYNNEILKEKGVDFP